MATTALATGRSRQARYGLVGGIILALFAARFWTLDEPPSWDAVWTTVSGAQFLADNGFDGGGLVDYGYQWFDAAWVRAWSPVTWFDGLVVWIAPDAIDTITALRVAHIVISALALGRVFRFAEEGLGRHRAFAVLGVTALLPVFLAQTSFIYFEIPMLLAIMVATNAAMQNRWLKTAIWAAIAAAIKSTGVFAAYAIAAELIFRKRDRRSVVIGLGLVVPATLVAFQSLGALENYSDRPTGGVVDQIATSLTVLVAIDHVFTVLLLAAAFGSLALAARNTRRSRQARLAVWHTAGFLGLFLVAPAIGQAQVLIPRYVVVIVPFVVYLAVDFMSQRTTRPIQIGALVAVLAVSVVNTRGWLNPAPRLENTIIQERSDAHVDLLRLQNEALEAAMATGLPVYVNANLYMRTQLPELGLVDEPARSTFSVRDGFDRTTLPDEFIISVSDSFAFANRELAEDLEESGSYRVEITTLERGGFEATNRRFIRLE